MQVPTQDQMMGQLRVIIPALGTIVSALGVSAVDVSNFTQIAMTAVGPISYLVIATWSMVANSRQSIMLSAAKSVAPGIPAPQIVLPAEEIELAQKLPDNVTTTDVSKVVKNGTS